MLKAHFVIKSNDLDEICTFSLTPSVLIHITLCPSNQVCNSFLFFSYVPPVTKVTLNSFLSSTFSKAREQKEKCECCSWEWNKSYSSNSKSSKMFKSHHIFITNGLLGEISFTEVQIPIPTIVKPYISIWSIGFETYIKFDIMSKRLTGKRTYNWFSPHLQNGKTLTRVFKTRSNSLLSSGKFPGKKTLVSMYENEKFKFLQFMATYFLKI